MGNISQSTIFSNVFSNIFSLLDNNLTDPSARGTKWIYSAFPDKNNISKSDFPFVVIEPSSIMMNPLTFSDTKEVEITVPIEIYSVKNSTLDTISDDIYDEIDKGRATLESAKLFTPRIVSSFVDNIPPTNERRYSIHYRSIIYRFTYHHG